MKHLEQEPRDELASFQLKELRRLIGFAARNVPFYSRKLRNVGLNSLEKPSDLSKLPLTQKEELRANFGETIAIGLKRRGILNRTSGSTGRPFAFYEDKASLGMTIASRFLFDSWAGVSAGQPRVRLVTRVHRLWPRLFFNEKQIPLSLVTPSKGTEVNLATDFRKTSPDKLILTIHPRRGFDLRNAEKVRGKLAGVLVGLLEIEVGVDSNAASDIN
jgi:hypothetical protein